MVKKRAGSMLSVFLIVVVVVVLRIDAVVELGEKALRVLRPTEETITPGALGDSPVVSRIADSIEPSPREKYLALMDSFRVSPELTFRKEAMELFKKHPQMFPQALDRDLEARVFRWRDLVIQNDPEIPLFLLDLAGILRGENQGIITRFFGVVFDQNFSMFIDSYPRTKDGTCAPVTLLESAVPAEDRRNAFLDRKLVLENFLARENLPPEKKLYASTCLTALDLQLQKETPPAPVDPVPEETAGESP